VSNKLLCLVNFAGWGHLSLGCCPAHLLEAAQAEHVPDVIHYACRLFDWCLGTIVDSSSYLTKEGILLSPEVYRRFAKRCREQAKVSRYEPQKERLLKLSQAWLAVADEEERLINKLAKRSSNVSRFPAQREVGQRDMSDRPRFNRKRSGSPISARG
jgi:hypothetical protein